MAVLSDRAAVLFAHMPATYGVDRDDVDPIVARWLEAVAPEVERLRALFLAVRATSIPARADDSVGSLSRWERAFGLAVAPEGVSVAQRVAQILTAIQARRVAYGRDWRAVMTVAAGGTPWTADANTPGPNQLTLTIPFDPDSYTGAQFKAIARRRTPAHVEIVMSYAGDFIVGVSLVGDAI
jgi:hypothetical protein